MSSRASPTIATSSSEPSASRAAAAWRSRARSLRTYLIVMMLAAALPVLIASIYTVQHVARSYRDNNLRRMLDTTKNLGHIIESDLASRAAMLQAYAANATRWASSMPWADVGALLIPAPTYRASRLRCVRGWG